VGIFTDDFTLIEDNWYIYTWSDGRLSDKDLTQIYNYNKKRLNRIAEHFKTSKYDDIELYYRDNKLHAKWDDDGKRLKSVESIEKDAINYFKQMREEMQPTIGYGAFSFMDNKEQIYYGIVYTDKPKQFDWSSHIEGNWYLYEIDWW